MFAARAPHLLSFLLILTALLYGGVSGRASEAATVQDAKPDANPAVAPHFALLVPTGSAAFARPAGIDAFRLAHALHGGSRDIDIDGVTGRLTLGPGGQSRRGLLGTFIDGGKITVLGETRP